MQPDNSSFSRLIGEVERKKLDPISVVILTHWSQQQSGIIDTSTITIEDYVLEIKRINFPQDAKLHAYNLLCLRDFQNLRDFLEKFKHAMGQVERPNIPTISGSGQLVEGRERSEELRQVGGMQPGANPFYLHSFSQAQGLPLNNNPSAQIQLLDRPGFPAPNQGGAQIPNPTINVVRPGVNQPGQSDAHPGQHISNISLKSQPESETSLYKPQTYISIPYQPPNPGQPPAQHPSQVLGFNPSQPPAQHPSQPQVYNPGQPQAQHPSQVVGFNPSQPPAQHPSQPQVYNPGQPQAPNPSQPQAYNSPQSLSFNPGQPHASNHPKLQINNPGESQAPNLHKQQVHMSVQLQAPNSSQPQGFNPGQYQVPHPSNPQGPNHLPPQGFNPGQYQVPHPSNPQGIHSLQSQAHNPLPPQGIHLGQSQPHYSGQPHGPNPSLHQTFNPEPSPRTNPAPSQPFNPLQSLNPGQLHSFNPQSQIYPDHAANPSNIRSLNNPPGANMGQLGINPQMQQAVSMKPQQPQGQIPNYSGNLPSAIPINQPQFKDQPAKCGICNLEIKAGSIQLQKCGHRVHLDCLRSTYELVKSDKCPIAKCDRDLSSVELNLLQPKPPQHPPQNQPQYHPQNQPQYPPIQNQHQYPPIHNQARNPPQNQPPAPPQGNSSEEQEAMALLAMDPLFMKCPADRCFYLIYNENKSLVLDCPRCNKAYCLKCKKISHPGQTCNELLGSNPPQYQQYNPGGNNPAGISYNSQPPKRIGNACLCCGDNVTAPSVTLSCGDVYHRDCISRYARGLLSSKSPLNCLCDRPISQQELQELLR